MAKREKNSQGSIDRISMLSDEFLVSLLSFLTLKEATATSILSRRWRYLCTFVPKLNFDGTESLLKVTSEARNSRLALYEERRNYSGWLDDAELALDEERWNFVGWVDDVIASHKGSTIEEFRVSFNLTKAHRKRIDKWLRYALAKKVRRLELNLIDDCSRKSREYHECYTFPYEFLCADRGNLAKPSPEPWNTRQCGIADFEFLRKLSVHYVNVSGEALEFFLRSCPLLEELSVSRSGELSTLKIVGPFPSFKRLEISLCHNLKSVEIRDAKIVCLKYAGSRIHFLLENVPLLVEISIGGRLTNRMEDVVLMLWSYLWQIEIFTMHDIRNISWEETEMFYSAVKMRNLKQLVVKFRAFGYDSLLPLTNLIRASPCLQRFVLEALYCNSESNGIRKLKKIASPYPHVKEVEFVHYHGLICEQELVVHFLENAVALEKILVELHAHEKPLYHMSNIFTDRITNDEISARNRAENQLRKIVPPRINLKIL